MTKVQTKADLERLLDVERRRAESAETKLLRSERIVADMRAQMEQDRMRENGLRDAILQHVTDNARLRGYLDRIEDETPLPRPMRYGIDQQRRASMGRGDDFAMMGIDPTRRVPHEWHHR